MKPVSKNCLTTRTQKIWTVLILTGIVSVCSGLAFISSSVAAYKKPLPETAKASLKQNATSDSLPRQVADAVLQNASEISGLSKRALTIIFFKRTHWAYGCEKPTFPHPCDPVLVSGWEVMVGAGNNRWLYFTDESGSSVKLSETGNQATLPTTKIVPPQFEPRFLGHEIYGKLIRCLSIPAFGSFISWSTLKFHDSEWKKQ